MKQIWKNYSLVAAILVVALFSVGVTISVEAQVAPGTNRFNYEVDCPSGYFPNPSSSTGYDTATALYVQAVCIAKDGSFWCYTRTSNFYFSCGGGSGSASTTIVNDITTITCSIVGSIFYSTGDLNFYICTTIGQSPVATGPGECAARTAYGYFCSTPQIPPGGSVGIATSALNATSTLNATTATVTINFQHKGDAIMVAGPSTGVAVNAIGCTDGSTTLTMLGGYNFGQFQVETNVQTLGNHTISCSMNGTTSPVTIVLYAFELSNYGSSDVTSNTNNGNPGISTSLTTAGANETIIAIGTCATGDLGGDCTSAIALTSTTNPATTIYGSQRFTPTQDAMSTAGELGAPTAGAYAQILAGGRSNNNGISLIALKGAISSPTAFPVLRPISSADIPPTPVGLSSLLPVLPPEPAPLIPEVLYNTYSGGQIASVSATTMTTSPSEVAGNGAFYLFSGYFDQYQLGVGCTGNTTVVANLIYTDPQASTTTTLAIGTFTITGNGTVGSSTVPNTVMIASKGTTTVQYSTTYTLGTGCTTNPGYVFFPALTELF